MKAILMAGGEGSRLRPLTISRPKPMVPIIDRPVMGHIIELLKRHGITEIVITVQYLANIIQDFFGDGSAYDVHISYSVEELPLGTAGSVKYAARLLDDEPFMVISGDALTDFDLGAIIAAHESKKAAATLTLTRVHNPLEYGVVITGDDGRIRQFLEKPSWGEVFSDTVNTGIYILDPSVLDDIPLGEPCDFSKDLFPALLRRGEPLYGYIAEGYWTDVGNIEAYIRACGDYLSGEVDLPRLGVQQGDGIWIEGEVEIAPDVELRGPIFLGHGVKIKSGAMIHGPSVVRDYTIIDARATVDRSIIWRNSYIGERAELRGAIVCKQCNVKSRSLLFEGVVVADGTVINSGAVIQPNVKIWPSKEVEEGATVSASIIWGAQGRRVLFGRYGITGLVNIDLTPEFCAKLGAAYGAILPKGAMVTINRDAHYTPRMLKRALVAGLPSAGINVLDLHRVPLPVARYMTYAVGAAGGIHVRLSPLDNRVVDIKFFNNQGLDLDTETERKIENTYFREDYRRVYLDEIGRIITESNGTEKVYVEAFERALHPEALQTIGAHFSLVVDYANSNAPPLLGAILRRMNVDVVELNANPDEDRLFQTAEQFQAGMQRLAAIVPVMNADLGVRLDSGSERIFVVDDTGHRLSDVELLAALTVLIMEANPGAAVAVPVTAPRSFDRLAERHGGTIKRTKTALSALMQQAARCKELKLLGDGAGSLIFPQFYPVSDGLFAIVKLMELLARADMRLSEIRRSLPRSTMDQTKVPCRWENKGKVMRILNEQYAERGSEHIDGIKIELGPEWVLILPDPDGPFIHVIAEGTTAEQAQVLTEKYAGLVMGLQ
ncbi:MAG TPA: mannose-1-phosphate guanyltransferase [Herpetosiphonaceae bacterium]